MKRMKRLNFNEGKSYSSIAQIINHDRSSNRLHVTWHIRTCLKRSSSSTSVKSKRVYKRKLRFAALAFIDAEVTADREISGRELQKRMQEKLHVNVSISLINRERRRMGWVQTSTRVNQITKQNFSLNADHIFTMLHTSSKTPENTVWIRSLYPDADSRSGLLPIMGTSLSKDTFAIKFS